MTLSYRNIIFLHSYYNQVLDQILKSLKGFDIFINGPSENDKEAHDIDDRCLTYKLSKLDCFQLH